jgi:hypothetical protein
MVTRLHEVLARHLNHGSRDGLRRAGRRKTPAHVRHTNVCSVEGRGLPRLSCDNGASVLGVANDIDTYRTGRDLGG